MSISLTEAAAKRIASSLAERGHGVGLRLGVKSTGCSGWAYAIDYAEEMLPEDQIFESHGVKVIVDADAMKYLDGTEVDFGREGLNEGFKFNNPNIKATCGCGESFSV
ncbi:MAG: iron-sulfur cluster assembly protein IscA [Chromatiales bacterium]|nr:iron-sulfur cluster assembly protein IscA [Chromatiales bacterium]